MNKNKIEVSNVNDLMGLNKISKMDNIGIVDKRNKNGTSR